MAEEANPVALAFGAAFIGAIFCFSLYGVTLAQTFIYFRTFQHDLNWTKALVVVLSVSDTLHVYLLGSLFYAVTVLGRATGTDVLRLPWELDASFMVSYTVTFIVQGFFCLRVWRARAENRFVTGFIAFTAIVQFGSGMTFCVYSIVDRDVGADFGRIAHGANTAELISSLLCDAVIAGSLIFFFHGKRIAGMRRTETILQKLIFLSVNMGVLLTVITLLVTILYEANGAQAGTSTAMALAPHLILSKLYVNSLLATLNARKRLREILDSDASFHMPSFLAGTHAHQMPKTSTLKVPESVVLDAHVYPTDV